MRGNDWLESTPEGDMAEKSDVPAKGGSQHGVPATGSALRANVRLLFNRHWQERREEFHT